MSPTGISANRLELLQIADAVAKEKAIDKEIVLSAMAEAIEKAAASKYGAENKIRVDINNDTGNIRLLRLLDVVEEVEDNFRQINLKDANSTEFKPRTRNKVISLVTEWKNKDGTIEKRNKDSDKGGTMRLGAQNASLLKESLARSLYKKKTIFERHRQYDQLDMLGSLNSGGDSQFFAKNVTYDNAFDYKKFSSPEYGLKTYEIAYNMSMEDEVKGILDGLSDPDSQLIMNNQTASRDSDNQIEHSSIANRGNPLKDGIYLGAYSV